MVFSFLTRVGLCTTFSAPNSSLVANSTPGAMANIHAEHAPTLVARSPVLRAHIVHAQGENAITPSRAPIPTPSRSSTIVTPNSNDNASHKPLGVASTCLTSGTSNLNMWQSMFNWTTLMMIITPKPRLPNSGRMAKKPVFTPAPTPNQSSSLFTWVVLTLSAVQRFISTSLANLVASIRSPFCPRSPPLPLLPHFIPPLPGVNISLDNESLSSATSLCMPTTPSDPIPVTDTILAMVSIPSCALEPTYRTPKPQASTEMFRAPLKNLCYSSKLDSTAKFRSVLADLEAQMEQHTFYDLDRELEQLDDQRSFGLGNLLSLKNLPPLVSPQVPLSICSTGLGPVNSPESPMLLPQVPVPARCYNNTIQVLPVITEVEESSPYLLRTPPYDASSWYVSRFNPLSGARVVGMAY
ncbi:hypothetical protein BDV93DRAFT_561064 [Ceratobasidium sp. AG-I]|nr:hypothetical protein BDV93DRAFT_561064 [Ceratobasidium sp. AG-I]